MDLIKCEQMRIYKPSGGYIAESDLLTTINQHYAIKGERIRLYRSSGGRVFFIQTPTGRKVFKLYWPLDTNGATQTTHIIPYL